MKRIFSLALVLITTFVIRGQNLLTHEYFKDKYMRKTCTVDKAKYELKQYLLSDSVIATEFRNISQNEILRYSEHKNNKPTGLWFHYDHKGNRVETNYVPLKYQDISNYTNYFDFNFPSDTINFNPAQVNKEAFYRFLADNLRYPRQAVMNGEQGKILVNIKILTNGKVEVLSFKEKISIHLEVEARRIMEKYQFPNASIFNDRAIESYTTIPINFQLK